MRDNQEKQVLCEEQYGGIRTYLCIGASKELASGVNTSLCLRSTEESEELYEVEGGMDWTAGHAAAETGMLL
jgi:hypothetical protein